MFKKVIGKENILFSIALASLDAPDDPVRAVVYPAVSGGEQTLRELVHGYKTRGPAYWTSRDSKCLRRRRKTIACGGGCQ